MAIERVSVYKLDTSPASDSLKDLRAQLKEAKNAMLSAEQGSDAYTAALQRAANIQHTLKEQMEEVNASAMDFGQIASNVTKTVGGMVAGIQAGNAVMNMMGYQSEDVAKSLQKMQNLMAITQAIPSLDEGFKAFKRLSTAVSTAAGATSKFSKALISTGLGAIAVALGYIVTHFEDISKWLDEVTGQTNLVATIIDNILAAWDTAGVAVIESLKLVGTAIKNHVLAPFKSTMAAINAYMGTNGTFADKMKAAAKAMKNTFVDSYKEIGDKAKELGTTVSTNFSANLSATVDARTKKDREKADKERKEREKQQSEFLANRKKALESIEDLNDWQLSEYEKDVKRENRLYQASKDNLEKSLKEKWITQEEYNKGMEAAEAKHQAAMKAIEDKENKRREKEQKDALNKQATELVNKYKAMYDQINRDSLSSIRDLSVKSLQYYKTYNFDKLVQLNEDWQAELKQMEEQGADKSFEGFEKHLENNSRVTMEKLRDQLQVEFWEMEAISQYFFTKFADNPEAIAEFKAQMETLKDAIASLNEEMLAFDISKEREQMDFLRDYADETANAMDLILGTGQGLSGYWTQAFETMSSSLINLGQTLREGKGDWSDYAKVAAAGLYTVGSIMSALAEEQNADTEEGFEQQKKYQIAAATMNMLGGITAAWVSALNPANAWMTIWGQIGMGAATTAMLLATGIMQIQKIKEQQFNGGGKGGLSGAQGASISPGAMAAITAPVQYTQDVQGADIENALADQRVYVLESDISKTQRRVNVAEGEARY